MCYACYEEAGKPEIISDKTKKAAQLIDAVYDAPGCGVGGYAHAVIDDYNLKDHHIKNSLVDAQKGENEFIPDEGQKACIECLEFLLSITQEERYSAMAIHEEWIDTK